MAENDDVFTNNTKQSKFAVGQLPKLDYSTVMSQVPTEEVPQQIPQQSNIDLSKWRSLVENAPERENPSIARRLGSFFVGLRYGPQAQEEYKYLPYERKMEDWKTKLGLAEREATLPAELESLRNKQLLDFYKEQAEANYRNVMAGAAQTRAEKIPDYQERMNMITAQHPGTITPSKLIEQLSGFYKIMEDPRSSEEAKTTATQSAKALEEAMEKSRSYMGNPTPYKDFKAEHPNDPHVVDDWLQASMRTVQSVRPWTTAEGVTGDLVFTAGPGGVVTPHFFNYENIPGLPGNVMPYPPTATLRTAGGYAGTVQEMIPGILNRVESLKDELGAIPGRINDWLVGSYGIKDPRFATLKQDLEMLATGAAMAHRINAEDGRDRFIRDLSTAQDVDDLVGRIETLDAWMSGYAALVGQERKTPLTNTPGTTDNKKSLTLKELQDIQSRLKSQGENIDINALKKIYRDKGYKVPK